MSILYSILYKEMWSLHFIHAQFPLQWTRIFKKRLSIYEFSPSLMFVTSFRQPSATFFCEWKMCFYLHETLWWELAVVSNVYLSVSYSLRNQEACFAYWFSPKSMYNLLILSKLTYFLQLRSFDRFVHSLSLY